MDNRLKHLAEQLDAGLIARREFLRKAAVITGGTAAGLHALRQMASAQPKTKLRVWLFKSYVTAGNDILAKHVEAWAKERNVEAEFDWATFGDREQKFVAAIEAGNPPDVAEMNYQGPMRYKAGAARRDQAGQGDRRRRAAGSCPYADRVMQFHGQYFGVARSGVRRRCSTSGRICSRRRALKMPKVYDPDVIDMAKKCQDPSKDLWGFGQTLNRCDDGNGFMQNILWNYGGSAWDKDGKPALATTFLKQNIAALQFAVDTIQKHKIQPPGVMGWTDAHNNEAYMAGKLVTTNNGASLYYAMVAKKHPLRREDAGHPHAGRARRHVRASPAPTTGASSRSRKYADLCRGHDPLGRGREALRGVHEGVASARRAPCTSRGPSIRTGRRDPNFDGDDAEHPAQRVARLSRADHAGGDRGAGAVHPLRHGGPRGRGLGSRPRRR